MALTNAERQERYRKRRQAKEPILRYRRPLDRRSRPGRWAEAVETLRGLQEEYQAWLDNGLAAERLFRLQSKHV
jgi:hypothetical protein